MQNVASNKRKRSKTLKVSLFKASATGKDLSQESNPEDLVGGDNKRAKRKSPDSVWWSHFYTLLEYESRAGSYDVPFNHVEQNSDGEILELGKWLERQVKLFNSGQLDQDKHNNFERIAQELTLARSNAEREVRKPTAKGFSHLIVLFRARQTFHFSFANQCCLVSSSRQSVGVTGRGDHPHFRGVAGALLQLSVAGKGSSDRQRALESGSYSNHFRPSSVGSIQPAGPHLRQNGRVHLQGRGGYHVRARQSDGIDGLCATGRVEEVLALARRRP